MNGAFSEGRWVTDDYYEERARQECIEKGNTPGELVGELPDLNIYPVGDINQPLRTLEERRAAAAASAGLPPGQLAGQGPIGSGGLYRSGGPTTHFGGQGLGPFDEAHVIGGGLGVSSGAAAARRAAMARDGVQEDNWMWKTALRVHEGNEMFANMRKSRLRPAVLGGDGGDNLPGGVDEALRIAREEQEETLSVEEIDARKQRALVEGTALGVYEPHTDIFHCKPLYCFQMMTLARLLMISYFLTRPIGYPAYKGRV